MYELITYGAGDKFWEFFNGLSAVVGDSSYVSIVQIAAFFAFGMAMFQVAFKIEIRPLMHWFFAFFLTFNIMLVPKVDLLITDRAMGDRQYVVANTPFGLTLFVSTFSQIGDKLTRLTETVFTTPDDLKYHKSGTLMAASLIETASRFQVTSPSMAKNLDSFMRQCVQYDILLNKYTLDDVFNEGNLWQFFKDTASPARAFLYNDDITTCSAGVDKLTTDWEKEIKQAQEIYGQRFFGETLDPAASLIRYLPISYQYMGNLSATATDIMQQNMIINAFNDSVISQGSQAGAAAAVESYGTARALQQQRAAYGISGRLARHILPMLKSVIELLIYGCFLLVFPIMLLPNSWPIIKNYILSLFWIQSWGPLYAVLNLFTNLDTRTALVGLIHSPHLELSAITIANLPGIEQIASDRALIAAYLSMVIPMISFGLIMTGRAYFPLLATQIAGTTQSAASTGAEEATTGNYSLGNVSLDNTNAYNTSGFHTNTNMAYQSDMLSMQTPQGGQQILAPDGEMLLQNSQATSQLNTNVNLGSRVSESLAQSYEETLTDGQNQMVSSYKAMSNTASDVYERGAAIADIHQKEGIWSNTKLTSESQSALDFKNQTDTLMADNGWNLSEAMNAQVGGSLRIGTKMANAGIDLNKTFSDAEQQSWGIASQAVDQQTLQSQLELGSRSEHTGSERHTGEESTRVSETDRTSFDEAVGLRDEASQTLSKAQSIREAMSKVEEQSASLNTRADQLVLNALRDEINTDTGKPYTIAELGKIDARDPQRMKGLAQKAVDKIAEKFIKSPNTDKAALAQGFEQSRNKIKQTTENDMKSQHDKKKDALKDDAALENVGKNPLNYEPRDVVDAQREKAGGGIDARETELAGKHETQAQKVKKRHRYKEDSTPPNNAGDKS